MNFLYPAFLIGAALAAIPVVLHLLRRDVAPQIPFTAVRLLKKSPIEQSRRRRLRDLLLLAARAAALLLLAFAFARPYFAGDASAGAVRIVAIDRSYSMGAPGRFARAIDRARAAVDAAPGSERVALVAFDDRADVLAPAGSAADARAALAGLQPGYGGTRYGPVFVKAAEIADGAPGTLILVTDLQRAGWEEQTRALLPPGFDLRIEDIGPPPPNLAVTAVRRDGDRLVASLRNTAAQQRGGELRAARDGRVVSSAKFSALPDATIDVALPFQPAPPANGALVISVDDGEGFAADNARYVLLDPVARPAALIVTSAGDARSGFYLARALDAASARADSFEPRPITGTDFASMPPDQLARYRVVVLLSTRGIDRRARGKLAAFARAGGGVVAAASPDVEASALSMLLDWPAGVTATEQPLTSVAFSATDLRHPIFRAFGPLTANLGQVRFDRSWRLRSNDWTVMARFTDGAPALMERPDGAGRVLLFASDLDRRWNDFPLHPSFVPFALEMLHHAGGNNADRREYVVSRVPVGVRAAPGIYQVADRAVAVNVDPRESSSARLDVEEFQRMVDRVDAPASNGHDVRALQAEARQSYWRYALFVMLGVLMAESMIGKA
jgi:aerotolerance regulator-like protein/VWA domain-containing protein